MCNTLIGQINSAVGFHSEKLSFFSLKHLILKVYRLLARQPWSFQPCVSLTSMFMVLFLAVLDVTQLLTSPKNPAFNLSVLDYWQFNGSVTSTLQIHCQLKGHSNQNHAVGKELVYVLIHRVHKALQQKKDQHRQLQFKMYNFAG